MRRVLLVAALAVSCSSCAFMNRRNRPLMNFCEKHLVPDSVAAKALTAPVVLPAGLAAGVIDTLVLHPVASIDDAWFDSSAVLWHPTGRGYVTECALLLPRASLTPPVWALHFSSRVLFDVPPWPPSPARLEQQLLAEDHDTRMLAVTALEPWSYKEGDVGPATGAMLKACRAYPKDVAFCEAVIGRIPRPLTDEAGRYLATLARTGQGEVCAVAIWRLFVDCSHWPSWAAGRGESAEHIQKAVDRLAETYDSLVESGHRAAEVYTAELAGSKTHLPGPRALAFYITRSLARRGWPDYAEASSFRLQMRLLSMTEAARIDAVKYEWRALQLKWDWLDAVEVAIKRLKNGGPSMKLALEEKQTETAEKLGRPGPGRAARLYELTEQLVYYKTLLDAEETAERLLDGPEADLRLFTGDPLELLKRKGKP